jgi:hypothetical protein
VRLLLAIKSVACSGESLVAFGLLTAVVVLSPPRDGGLRLVVVMAAEAAATGAALYTVSKASRFRTRRSPVELVLRATVALAASASVLMVINASMAALR